MNIICLDMWNSRVVFAFLFSGVRPLPVSLSFAAKGLSLHIELIKFCNAQRHLSLFGNWYRLHFDVYIHHSFSALVR